MDKGTGEREGAGTCSTYEVGDLAGFEGLLHLRFERCGQSANKAFYTEDTPNRAVHEE
jgi:hypothetical protein